MITNHRLDWARWDETAHIGSVITPTLAVVHGTASRLDNGNCVAYLRRNPAKVAYHFVIERDGEVVQMAPCNRRLNHAGRSSWQGRRWCNGFSVGIGLVCPGELRGTATRAKPYFNQTFAADSDGIVQIDTPSHGRGYWWLPYTAAQLNALDKLLIDLRAAYALDVAAHYEVSPGRKIDPTPLLDMKRLRALPQSRPQTLEEDADQDGDAIEDSGWPFYDDSLAGHEMNHDAVADGAGHVIQDTAPASKVLAKSSREYRAQNALKGGFVGVGGAALGGLSLENIQATRAYVDTVTGFAQQYGAMVVVGLCLGGWLLIEAIQEWKRQSYDEGRYEPSGESK